MWLLQTATLYEVLDCRPRAAASPPLQEDLPYKGRMARRQAGTAQLVVRGATPAPVQHTRPGGGQPMPLLPLEAGAKGIAVCSALML